MMMMPCDDDPSLFFSKFTLRLGEKWGWRPGVRCTCAERKEKALDSNLAKAEGRGERRAKCSGFGVWGGNRWVASADWQVDPG
jgi:hypothetical protein